MRARGIGGDGSLHQSSSGKGIVAQGRSHTARSQCSRKHIVRGGGTIVTNEGEERKGREGVLVVDEKERIEASLSGGDRKFKVVGR